jgi:hypothetical protein
LHQLGEEVLTYISSQAWGTSVYDTYNRFSVTYEAGRGRQVEVELFKSDCTTPITHSEIISGYSASGREKSLTHDMWEFYYFIYDSSRLDELGIYNRDTLQLEVCHKARLVSTPTVEDVRNLMINFELTPEGNKSICIICFLLFEAQIGVL